MYVEKFKLYLSYTSGLLQRCIVSDTKLNMASLQGSKKFSNLDPAFWIFKSNIWPNFYEFVVKAALRIHS